MKNLNKLNSPYIIGHRGYGKNKYNLRVKPESPPESSVESIQRALLAGAVMVELDVRLSKTGEVICFHDYKLAGKVVNTMALDEIRTLQPQTPTISDLARFLPGVPIIFELKFGEDYEAIISQIRSFSDQIPFSWISFDINALRMAEGDYRAWTPSCLPHVHMLPGRFHPFVTHHDIELADAMGIDQIACHPLSLSNRIAYKARSQFNLDLGTEANSVQTAIRMIDRGVNYLYTDNVPVIVDTLNKLS